MFRFLSKFLFVLMFAALGAAGILLYRSSDPLYTAQEWLARGRYQQYDALIAGIARKNDIDPLLVKAVIWRESSFRPEKVGKNGEHGLMQVTQAAANDWVKAKKIESFVPTDLFSPKTNIEAGTWYLKQALQRWGSKDDPLTFALTEYNAGRGRVDKWIGQTNMGTRATAGDLRGATRFESTRSYVEAIIARYKFYQAREKRRE